MAGLDPAIHVFRQLRKFVDATGERSDAVLRTAVDKPGHDKSLSHWLQKLDRQSIATNPNFGAYSVR